MNLELERANTLAWYRNPSRARPDSLGIKYSVGDGYKIVRPDFIFFVKQADGSIAADIIDPHGIHLSDALAKLRGLAEYAEKHDGVFRRIEAIAKVGAEYKVLDVSESKVRDAIKGSKDITELYMSDVAAKYM